MIVNIRGTNGSGKSTVVRAFMDHAGSVHPIYGSLGLREPEAYKVRHPHVQEDAYVLGPYVTLGNSGVEAIVKSGGVVFPLC